MQERLGPFLAIGWVIFGFVCIALIGQDFGRLNYHAALPPGDGVDDRFDPYFFLAPH